MHAKDYAGPLTELAIGTRSLQHQLANRDLDLARMTLAEMAASLQAIRDYCVEYRVIDRYRLLRDGVDIPL